MESILHKYRDLKFRVNHLLVAYRQRYYSTHKNPRVIQSRVQNQQLLSLRTFPKDPYLTGSDKPFLHLSNEYEETESQYLENSDERDYTLFEYTNDMSLKAHDSATHGKSYSEPNFGEGYFLTFRLELPINPSSDEQHQEITQFDPTQPAEQCEPLLDMLITTDEYLSGSSISPVSFPCTCHCHTFEKIPPQSSTNKRNHNVKEKFYDFVVNNFSKVTGQGNDTVATISSNIETFTPLDIQATDSIETVPDKTDPTKGTDRIWKLVLNDVSLSAARLSTGSSNIPVVNNQNIRGDFINAKVKTITNNENEDIFNQ